MVGIDASVSEKLVDVSLTESEKEPGKLVAHRIDCPYARMLANAGEPVFTMLGMTAPLPDDVERHSCLEVSS
jgi:hypothetical protein